VSSSDAVAGFDASHYNGNPPSPPPQLVPSSDVLAAANDPEGVAEAHRQNLSFKLHELLVQGGGHATVTFKGPNGVETFDLAALVNILDHYHVVASGKIVTVYIFLGLWLQLRRAASFR
jgi:hypothetical protein